MTQETSKKGKKVKLWIYIFAIDVKRPSKSYERTMLSVSKAIHLQVESTVLCEDTFYAQSFLYQNGSCTRFIYIKHKPRNNNGCTKNRVVGGNDLRRSQIDINSKLVILVCFFTIYLSIKRSKNLICTLYKSVKNAINDVGVRRVLNGVSIVYLIHASRQRNRFRCLGSKLKSHDIYRPSLVFILILS